MTARTKSVVIIIGTLLVGVIIGALATGAVLSQRVVELQALRNENGLAFFIERIIEPTDEEQKERIRFILDETTQRHIEIRQSMLMQHRDVFRDMMKELSPVLTQDQNEELNTWMQKERRRRPGPPGFMRQGGREHRFQRIPRDSSGRPKLPFRRARPGFEADSVRADSSTF